MRTKEEKVPEVTVQYFTHKEQELITANKELAFQNEEKEKREAELIIANKELAFQNTEKAKRAAELVLANKELLFQNREKEKRAAELIIANKELAFQNTEKEKRAAEFTRSKQFLDETGRLAKVGGWEIDLKKNELTWSNVVYQIYEVEPDYQPTVESAINFFSPEAIPVISEAVRLAIEEGRSFDIDLQFITAKQNMIWVRTIGQAYRVNGEIVKIGGVFQNINERKREEHELIAAKEKAEESDSLKSAFLNNISHEIRTPFNGILGFLSIIQDHDLPDDEREEYINIINQSADRLMNTINDIVEVSHIQSGQMKLIVQETNIKKLTDELFDQFNTIAESKGLEFNINNDLPNNIASISTDGIKLKTILSNLIGNAMKFTKAGSIELGIRKKSDYLEFFVKDTGIGIPKNKQLVIFERFMQADASNIRQFEGLGLGLSIVKAYVIMLGGKFWLESEEGKGTTFYFILQYNAKPEKIIWSDELSIGNTDIDIDHKRLVDINNELIDYVESKDNSEEFAMILSKMTEYSLGHFKKEEKYMQKMSYPELLEHKRLHKDFSYKVAMYNIDLLGVDPPEIKNIIKSLKNWWIDHVLNEDKKYEDYKKEIHSDVTY